MLAKAKGKCFMSTGLNNKLTGQVGEYLVCAELGRRGLIATPFAGNVPTFDVLATDAKCRTVPIQVKCSNSDTFPSDARKWMDIVFNAETGEQKYQCGLTIDNPDLIYVCVVIAPPRGLDRFFVLKKFDLQQVCIDAYTKWMEPHDWIRPKNRESYHNVYSTIGLQPFEDNWQLITERLKASSPDRALISGAE